MIIKKLKSILTIILLSTVLWPEIHCMESKSDILEAETVNRSTSAIQSVCNAIDFVTHNPEKALIVGLCLSSQFIIASAENAALYNCHCTLDNGIESVIPSYCPTGQSFNVTLCDALCDAFNNFISHGCY